MSESRVPPPPPVSTSTFLEAGDLYIQTQIKHRMLIGKIGQLYPSRPFVIQNCMIV